MIHILQSVSNMDRGGIESMLMNYYRHLDRTRFQFDFLVNKKKPGFFEDEIRALGGRIFQSPGVAPQSYPAYLRSMQQLLAQHPEIKVLHAHNEAMQLFALEGAKKAGLPVRIAHAHNTCLPKDAKLPIKWFCKQFIPGAATDYWACGREAGIYYFGQSAWDARGVTLRNAIDLERFGYRPEGRAKLRAEYGLNDKLVVGCVARLMAQKNHTRLLDIFAALKKVCSFLMRKRSFPLPAQPMYLPSGRPVTTAPGARAVSSSARACAASSVSSSVCGWRCSRICASV